MSRARLTLGTIALFGLGAIFAAPRAQAEGANGIEYQATEISGNDWQQTIFFYPLLSSDPTDTSLGALTLAFRSFSWWTSARRPCLEETLKKPLTVERSRYISTHLCHDVERAVAAQR